MPRKSLTLARAPHDGQWHFSVDLKLWQTIIGVLLGLIALYGAAKAGLSSLVAGIAADKVSEEIAKQYKPALDEWKRGVDGQIGGLRRADSEQKESIAKLQANDVSILETIASQKQPK